MSINQSERKCKSRMKKSVNKEVDLETSVYATNIPTVKHAEIINLNQSSLITRNDNFKTYNVKNIHKRYNQFSCKNKFASNYRVQNLKKKVLKSQISRKSLKCESSRDMDMEQLSAGTTPIKNQIEIDESKDRKITSTISKLSKNFNKITQQQNESNISREKGVIASTSGLSMYDKSNCSNDFNSKGKNSKENNSVKVRKSRSRSSEKVSPRKIELKDLINQSESAKVRNEKSKNDNNILENHNIRSHSSGTIPKSDEKREFKESMIKFPWREYHVTLDSNHMTANNNYTDRKGNGQLSNYESNTHKLPILHKKHKTSTVSINQQNNVEKIKTKILNNGFQDELLNDDELNVDVDVDENIDLNNRLKNVTVSEKRDQTFPDYVPTEKAKQLLKNQDPTCLKYVEGYIRINPYSYKHAYISINGEESDIKIIGFRDRNRAFEGDLVIIEMNPQDQWIELPDGRHMKTGTVICIVEKIHTRRAIGQLILCKSFMLFQPRDKRVPIFKVPLNSLHNIYNKSDKRLNEITNSLYFATLTQWKNPTSAFGRIDYPVGETGNISVETNAILLENDLDITPYSPDLIKELPGSDYEFSSADLKNREDWRKECIISIDPVTAKDLDDALSCKILENGNYQIGVHIADVTHFVKFFSPLDLAIAERAVTYYMTDNVYHMLPEELCHLCSLVPGKDRLAFSVIWEMTPTADVISHRFTKTVINSCCQLSYDQAQVMIENSIDEWKDKNDLNIKGEYTPFNLHKIVNNLYEISKKLTNRRFAGGALKIDQPKLQVIVDPKTKMPISFKIEDSKDSNRLIEEFMLLANTTVANYLYHAVPETALLRHHQKPVKRLLTITRDTLRKFGVHLDIESAGSLQASIKRYEGIPKVYEPIDQIMKYRMLVINNLCSKTMKRANYKCANSENIDSLKHYALNVDLYTHFTSPIRRYSDCIVHRLLHAAIRNDPLPPKWSAEMCSKIADKCNRKKYAAKIAQEQSNELFFTYLISLSGPMNCFAIVSDVKLHMLDVIICDVGIKTKIFIKNSPDVTVTRRVENDVSTLTIVWKKLSRTQVITIFSIINVKLEKQSSQNQLQAILLPP